jgi:hypothetical protein
MALGVFADVQVDAADFNMKMAILQVRLSASGLQDFMENTMVPFLQMRADRRFAIEGDEVSGRWLPLKRATTLMRLRQGYPPQHPINVRSGQMKTWITSADGNVRAQHGMADLTWPGNPPGGTMLKKIQTAQMGQAYPSTAPRPVIGVGDDDNIFALAQLTQYLLS